MHNFFRLINKLQPGAVKKVNTMKAPFKQVKDKPFSMGFGVLSRVRYAMRTR